MVYNKDIEVKKPPKNKEEMVYMKNVKTMKDLQVVLSTMDYNEFGTTGNFTVGEVENIIYSVSINEDDKCYDIHVINFKLNKYQNYSYKRFSAVVNFFAKKLD